MNIRELMRMMLLQFFICYTCTMAATVFFCRFNTPPVTVLEVSYLWQAGIFSLCVVLPVMLYYAKEELSTKQWWNRTIAHTVVLEAVALTAGRIIGMYQGIAGGAAFFVTVLIIDGLVRWFTYLGDRSVADAINKELKETRERDEAYH